MLDIEVIRVVKHRHCVAIGLARLFVQLVGLLLRLGVCRSGVFVGHGYVAIFSRGRHRQLKEKIVVQQLRI